MKITEQDKKLIEEAKKVIIKSKPVKLIDTGKVGSALITSKGNIFSGVNIRFLCGIDSCAEYNAVGAMVSNGEKRIKTIVAVEFNLKTKKYDILPPCGTCREMMHQLTKKNETYVIISYSEKVKLNELLPHAWKGTIEK